jgi:hypothetical protein
MFQDIKENLLAKERVQILAERDEKAINKIVSTAIENVLKKEQKEEAHQKPVAKPKKPFGKRVKEVANKYCEIQ